MSTDLEIVEHPVQSMTLFRSDEPDEIIARATSTAGSLAKVIRSQKLAVTISGREHVRVEGWTLLGTLLGVFPYLVWTRPLELRGDGLPMGWEARCEARTIDGRVVGSAEAMCSRSEKTWANRDDYALRSMAQTRATSKALRQPLGFVMALAGFEATPAEEMPAADGEVAEWTGVPDQFIVTFGKYKGQTIAEIAAHDRGYVGWLGEKAENQAAKDAAKAFLGDEDIPF